MKLKLLLLLFCLLSQVSLQAQVQANDPDPLLICENNPTGFAFFDLTQREGQIPNVPPQVDITYYATASEAQNNTNQIPNPSQYQNITNPETIYVRVEDPITGDYAVVELLLIIDEYPQINTSITDLYAYTVISEGIGIFDLTEKIPEIIGNQTGLTMTFYETETNAQNELDEIIDPTAYQNTQNPTTIYVRVENSSGCYSIASFILNPEEKLSIVDFTTNKITVFPNPSKDIVNIYTELNEKFQISVFSLNGSLVIQEMQMPINSEDLQIDISNLVDGIYFLSLTSENVSLVKKIIKN